MNTHMQTLYKLVLIFITTQYIIIKYVSFETTFNLTFIVLSLHVLLLAIMTRYNAMNMQILSVNMYMYNINYIPYSRMVKLFYTYSCIPGKYFTMHFRIVTGWLPGSKKHKTTSCLFVFYYDCNVHLNHVCPFL